MATMPVAPREPGASLICPRTRPGSAHRSRRRGQDRTVSASTETSAVCLLWTEPDQDVLQRFIHSQLHRFVSTDCPPGFSILKNLSG